MELPDQYKLKFLMFMGAGVCAPTKPCVDTYSLFQQSWTLNERIRLEGNIECVLYCDLKLEDKHIV